MSRNDHGRGCVRSPLPMLPSRLLFHVACLSFSACPLSLSCQWLVLFSDPARSRRYIKGLSQAVAGSVPPAPALGLLLHPLLRTSGSSFHSKQVTDAAGHASSNIRKAQSAAQIIERLGGLRIVYILCFCWPIMSSVLSPSIFLHPPVRLSEYTVSLL